MRLRDARVGPQCGATHGFERVIMGGEVCASTACTRNCLIEVVASYSSERGVADFAQPLHVVVAETWVVWSPSSRLARRCVLSCARSDGQYYPKGADYAQGLEQCGMGVAGCTRSSRSARRSDCCRALAGRLRRERCVQLPHLVRHRRRPHCAGHGRARLSPTHGSSSAAVSADPPPPDRARPLHRPRHQPDLTTRRAVSQLSRVTIGFSHSNRTVL